MRKSAAVGVARGRAGNPGGDANDARGAEPACGSAREDVVAARGAGTTGGMAVRGTENGASGDMHNAAPAHGSGESWWNQGRKERLHTSVGACSRRSGREIGETLTAKDTEMVIRQRTAEQGRQSAGSKNSVSRPARC